MGNHFTDYSTYRLLENCSWPAKPGEIPEAVQAPFVIPSEPVAHPFFRLHEICCHLTDVLLAHTDHVDDKNPSPYSGIFFAPVCLFEIVLFVSLITHLRLTDLETFRLEG